MAIEADGKAPYAPAGTLIEVLEFDRKRGLPTPVTLDTLVRVGVTESLSPRTLQALRLLDLLDDEGFPTAAMSELRKAPESEYKKTLEQILRAAYADVFAYFDPSEDDPTRARDAFRSYRPTGQQERMVTLFFGLCAYAGLVDDSAAPRPKASKTTARPVTGRPTRLERPRSVGARSVKTQQEQQLPLLIQALLEQLPGDGAWTASRRAKWLQAAELAVDMLYEITDPRSED